MPGGEAAAASLVVIEPKAEDVAVLARAAEDHLTQQLLRKR
jgi:hypothetical protein